MTICDSISKYVSRQKRESRFPAVQSLWKSLWIALCVTWGFGCLTPQSTEVKRERGLVNQGVRLADQAAQSRRADERITKYDLNHDGTPDVFAYTVPVKGDDGKEVQRLIRKELDLNFDGKIDITKWYDAQEQV